MSGSTDAGRLLVRIEATTAQLRQQLQAAEQQVAGTAAKIDTQLKQADKAFSRLEEASKATQQAVAGLASRLGPMGGALSALGTGGAAAAAGLAVLGAGLVQVARAGDEANATLAKLSSATGSMAQASQVYEGLFRLSQQTGIAVAESAGAFSRFAVAAKEIGGTNAQVLALVGGIQKAGIVAGASAQEAGAAVQQLAQALASGKLQGDELRSLLENMPQLAQALARELGVGIGRLREMGTEGKLTADVVFPALLRATEKIGAEFDKMPMTIGRASGALASAVQNFGAELDKALGLSQRIAAALQAAANAINNIQRVILPTERQAAEAAALSTRQRADEMRGRLSDSRDRAQFPDGPAGDRLFAAARANEDPRMARDVEAAEQAARDAEARLQSIRREARELERVERDEAARQALESARQQSQVAAEQVRLDLDKDYAARKKHEERLKVIDQAEARGAISSAQAAAQRKLANDDLTEGLEKLAGAHKAVGKEAAEADAHLKEFLKDQEKQAEAAARAQEKAADAMRRYHERSFDELVSIGERAFDRLGDALVDAFVSGSGAAVNFGNVARAIAASVITDFAKLAVINPILNSLFISSSGPRPTLSAALGGGGIGDLLGLGSMFGGEGVSSFLFGSSAPLQGPSLSGAPIAAGMEGLIGSGGNLFGVAGLNQFIGGVGIGAGIGGFTASMMGGNSTYGSIGGAAGAALGQVLIPIPGVGAVIGAIAGGGLGGMIGPGPSVQGYGFRLQSANYDEATGGGGLSSSLLPISRQFYNDSGAAAFAQAEQLVAATNAYLAQRGLLVGGASVVGGNKNGADYSWADAGSLEEAFTRLSFGAANDNVLGSALSGRSFSGLGDLQAFVEGYSQVRDTIAELTDTHAEKLDKALEAVNKQFDDLSTKARTYGLAEDGLAQARERALQATRNASSEQADALLRDLTFGRSSALAPEQRYFAALTTLNQARQDLDAGGNAASYASIAQQVLPVARDYLGTSQRYAALVADVAAAVRTAGGGSESSATLSALLSAQVEGAQMNAEIGSLTASEIRALRGSMDRLSATMQAILTRQQAA